MTIVRSSCTWEEARYSLTLECISSTYIVTIRASCVYLGPAAIAVSEPSRALMCAAAGRAGSGSTFLRARKPDNEYQRQNPQSRAIENVIGGQPESLLIDQ